jgi:hypothetical protein
MRAERRRNIVRYFNFLFHEFRYAFSTIKFTNIELIILNLSCTGYLNKFNTLIQTAMCRAAVQFSTTWRRSTSLRHARSTESGTALRHYSTHVLQNLVWLYVITARTFYRIWYGSTSLRHTRSTKSGTALRHYGTHVLQNLVWLYVITAHTFYKIWYGPHFDFLTKLWSCQIQGVYFVAALRAEDWTWCLCDIIFRSAVVEDSRLLGYAAVSMG